MKINMANPRSGLQKCLEVDDEKKLLPFFEKRMGAEVVADSIGAEFEGYLFRISGGNDKQGFPMMQGVLANHRVRLLFTKGMSGYRPRKKGEKKRKSIRGCIVGPDLAVLNLVLVKKGAGEIPGLTDGEKPRRLGPKRASNIRRLFNLDAKEDVRRFVVRRQLEGKKKTKAPKIQRLITKSRLQRKRHEKKIKRQFAISSRAKAEAYKQLVATHRAEVKERKAHHLEAKKKKKLSAGGSGEATKAAATAASTAAAATKGKAAATTKPSAAQQKGTAASKGGAAAGAKGAAGKKK